MFHELRRSDRAMEPADAEKILRGGEYGVLSTVSGDGSAYGVPLNYVYDGACVYFHCAGEGHKLENLRARPHVSFCVVGVQKVVPEKLTTRYESVILFGEAAEAQGEEKLRALRLLVEKYAPGAPAAACSETKTANTHVVRIRVEHLCGKHSR